MHQDSALLHCTALHCCSCPSSHRRMTLMRATLPEQSLSQCAWYFANVAYDSSLPRCTQVKRLTQPPALHGMSTQAWAVPLRQVLPLAHFRPACMAADAEAQHQRAGTVHTVDSAGRQSFLALQHTCTASAHHVGCTHVWRFCGCNTSHCRVCRP